MAQILLLAGAAILGILGTAHLLFTFFTDNFLARDPHVTQAMQQSSPNLTPQTTMWRAWVGFNASHSLGMLFIATTYGVLAVRHMEMFYQNKSYGLLIAAIGLSYLVLARRYWFRAPFLGILAATLCFAAANVLVYF